MPISVAAGFSLRLHRRAACATNIFVLFREQILEIGNMIPMSGFNLLNKELRRQPF
jgi:hypothetical protein